MLVYSKKIIQFVSEIQQTIKHILSKEIGLKVFAHENRFYNRAKNASYPIKIVIFNNMSMLGYFNSEFYELGFHERLMHAKKEQLANIIRHELAHYMNFMDFGPLQHPHGSEFKTFCALKGWNEEVSKATICLECEDIASDDKESAILRKIQKLLALTSSANQNEAEVAMIKSQQLLLKYNLEPESISTEGEDKVFLKRILKQKRLNGKLSAIAKILQTFFVNTVYSRLGEFIYLEIMGTAVNVEIAEYVANVLQVEFEKLWDRAQKLANLKGITAKNSFFLGIAKGYCNKIEMLKREYNTATTIALMVIEKQLSDAKALVYPALSSVRSQGHYCEKSSALGELMGKQLNINSALSSSSKTSENLLVTLK